MKKLATLFASVMVASALVLANVVNSSPAQAAAPNSISRAQFDAIKNEMTQAEVEAIVGTLGEAQLITPHYVDCHNEGDFSVYGYRFAPSAEFGGADVVIWFVGYAGKWEGWNLVKSVFYPFCVNHGYDSAGITSTWVSISDSIWKGAGRESIDVPHEVYDGSQWYQIGGVVSDAVKLKRLDVSLAPNVEFVSVLCRAKGVCGNMMEQLVLGEASKLTSLVLDSTRLSSLDISGAFALSDLYLTENANLVAMDLSKNAQLRLIYVPNNGFPTLDISGNPLLERLYAPNNRLTSVLFGCNPQLTNVDVANNQLANLSLGSCPQLTELNVSYNRLTKLDVSKQTNLRGLVAANNKLAKLNVTKNKQLVGLATEVNKGLKKVNCSKLSKLKWMNASYKLAKKWLPKQLRKTKPKRLAKYYYYYHR